MKQDYVTTNVRLPKAWHKILKQRAMERDESLGELIRGYIAQCLPAENIAKSSHIQKKTRGSLLDLLKIARHFWEVFLLGMIINNAIIYEILTVLSRKDHKKRAIEVYKWMNYTEAVKIATVNNNLESWAFFIYKHSNSKYKFFDCTIFATADAYNTKYIL